MSQVFIRPLKVLLPLVVLAGAVGAAYVMYINRPPVETRTPVIEPPSVRVQRVEMSSVDLTVSSQGTVQPRTSSQLVPEISGSVIEVSPSFAVGGFFEEGDVLLKIDPYDYQQAVISGRSQLAQAKLRLAQEEAEAEVARREWEEIGRGNATALTLRQPQVEDARAAVAAAEAALERAERDLERSEVKAPYAGRVQSKDVDVGQFVNKGNTVGRIYAVDSAEIRLPLPDEELAYVDVPMSYRGNQQQTGPRVTLVTDFAGRRHTWQGRIVRTESEIDPVSRMVHVVAEVADPYGASDDPSRPPLAAGMFVEAEITGRRADNVVELPWAALRGRNQVLVVEDGGRLRFRDVEVLRSTTDSVLISSGLAEGEVVCISALDTVTDGMAVRVLGDNGDAMATAEGTPATQPTPPAAAATPSAPEPQAERPALAAARQPPPDRLVLDPSMSREEQIAAIRNKISALQNTEGDAEAASPPATEVSEAPPARRGPRRLERAGRPAGRRGPTGERRTPPTETPSPPAVPAAPEPPAPAAEPPSRAQAPAGAPAPDVSSTPRTSRPRVAVLPFANLSRNPADDAITDAIDGVLRTAFDTVGLDIVSLAANSEATALDAAAGRNARWLIGGGFQRIGNQLRVTGRLLAVSDGTLQDSIKLDGSADDIESLTDSLVARLRTQLNLGDPSAAADPPTERVARDRRPRVAVAQFANLSRNPGDARIQQAVTAAVAGGLIELTAVVMVPLDDQTDDAKALPAAASRQALWLVGGGFQQVAGQLRLTARLLDVASGAFLETVKVDGPVDQLPELLHEVVSTLRDAVETQATQLADAAAQRRP